MKLYDTRTGTKRDFTPSNEEVKMYVCGPNLYGPSHVGHALSYIVFDVLRRYLEYQGYRVHHVQNFTDIEDRIIEAARREGRSINELADHYIQRFLQEMEALGVLKAHDYPRATEYIGSMIDIIKELIAKEYAYAADGDVYFRVRSFADYGRLSRRSLDEMQAGARIEVDPRKEDPMDFTLWKASKDGEPSWPSPWGPGRPGWHIECTAMSLGLLGEQLDIHGGGQDVVFPHHENEIAQSEGYTEKSPFVRFWVHNGLLRLAENEDEKMTRHSGNFVSCREVLAIHHQDAIRLFLLSSHYRSPQTYSEEELVAHERAAERMRTALEPAVASERPVQELQGYRERFEEAMDDDLNTPRALAVLFELTREINRHKEAGGDVAEAQALLKKLGDLLGLSFSDPTSTDSVAAHPFIELLIEVRRELREAKQYTLADSIRARLKERGVALEDGPEGTSWRLHQTDASAS